MPKPTDKPARGGARKGAGRKSLAAACPGVPADEPTVTFTVKLPRCVATALDRGEARDALMRLWRKSPG